MEIRSLDLLLATVGPDGLAPGYDDAAQLLAEGAVRLKQGEYLWPLAMQGRPVPEGQMPLPPAFTSVHITDPACAVMRSDWSARAHFMRIDGSGTFTAHAYGRFVASGSGLAPAGASLWTTGLFLDALSSGERTVLFVKPVGDLPGYWLISDLSAVRPAFTTADTGVQVVVGSAPRQSGGEAVQQLGEESAPAHAQGEGTEFACLLAPYERYSSQLGAMRLQAWSVGGSVRCYRVLHALGYDIHFLGDGEKHTLPELELTTDARFALIRVRGHQVVARQVSRATSLIFREEALA